MVGSYRVRPGFRAIRDAFRCHGVTERVRQEMRTIVLLEFEVRGATGPLDLIKWHQRYLQHVPYDEVYFSLDRRRLIARGFQQPQEADYAVAFYLHFFDPKRPLVTPYGRVRVPKPKWPRPPHLENLQYAYWD